MGALHAGHAALLARARRENDIVVMTLFVNPTQFNEMDDYEKYPRVLGADERVAEAEGVDYILAPDMHEVYPKGFDTVVAVRRLSDILEGKSRPGHLQGVSTVVTKLLLMVQADRAYFGEKDYQQLQIIRRLTSDLNIPVDVIGCPIIREADGLALSSRNARLSEPQRKAATVLHTALAYAQEIADTGVHDANVLRAWIAQTIEVEPLASLDYAEIVDEDDLMQVDTIDVPSIALVAARFGDVRLIDNLRLRPAPGIEMRR
jgi:pantoate--beta-alanine ligase